MIVSDLFTHCERTIWRNVRSRATLKTNLKILRRLIGDEDLTALHFTRLERLVTDLEALGGRGSPVASPATVKRRMETLSAALTHATKMTNEDGSPVLFGKPAFPAIEVDNIQERTLSDIEAIALFEVIDARTMLEPDRDWSRFRVFVRFLLDTACRKGEALGVWPGHVETRTTGRTLVGFPRYSTKNKKPRYVPLSAYLVSMIPALRLRAGNGPLFPFTHAVLFKFWEDCRADMRARGFEIGDVKFHTLRHTALTKAAKQHSIQKVSLLAGHSSIQITATRYAHLTPDDLGDLVDTIAA